MAKTPKPAASSSDGLTANHLKAAFGSTAGSMGCPVQPDPDTDWRIPGSWDDARVGHTIRDLAGKGYVLAVWVCNGELWVRPLDLAQSTLVAQA